MKLEHKILKTAEINTEFEKIITEIFTKSFSQKLPSQNYFNWKYKNNPEGDSLHLLTMAEGKWIASRAFWRIGLGKKDYQCVDTCVLPDFQKLGVFEATSKYALSNINASFYNIPNSKSLPQYKKYGWKVNNYLKPRVYFFRNLVFNTPTIQISEKAARWRYKEHPFFEYRYKRYKGFYYIFRVKKNIPILIGKLEFNIGLRPISLLGGLCCSYSTIPGVGIEFGSISTVISNNHSLPPLEPYWFDMF